MTEHERRVHDKTIKAYEAYEVNGPTESGLAKIGQDYSSIQQKYIGKAFHTGSSPTSSPMMNNAKRPNINEVISLSPSPYGGGPAILSNGNGTLHSNMSTDTLRKKAGSQLAMAGSMNILSQQSNTATIAAER